MKEKPKSRSQSIVSKKMMTQIIVAALWVTALSLVFLNVGFIKDLFDNEKQLLTGYFSLFVLSAVFNGFNVRNEGCNVLRDMKENKNFLKIMGIIVVVQICLTSIPGVVNFLDCEPISIVNWLIIFGLAILIIPFDMLRKVIMNSKNN